MNQYIARQPIFNVHKKLYAYELLYRGTDTRSLADVSGEQATASLLSSAFLTKEIDDISSHRPCFVNFTQKLLERNLPVAFPKAKIVVEILEDVEPTPKVLAICRDLHDKGYTLALDDFVYHRRFEPFLEIADIVKIDVRLTPLGTLTRTLNLLSRHKVKLLAEKVESLGEFERSKQLGFSYFQGYFFCKPERIGIKELSTAKVTLIRLLAEIAKKSTSIERLRAIISTDVAITYKLMRFMNSAYFYRLQEVKSVEQAVAFLGQKELRRFLMLIIIAELSTEKPDELVTVVLVRAKLCEILGEKCGLTDNDVSNLFVMGLFSLLDAMLDSTMEDVVGRLPLSDTLKAALLHRKNEYAKFLDIAIAFERNQQSQVFDLHSELGLDQEEVQESYFEAVKYANHLL